MTNYQLITDGFQTLRASMAPFIARELIKVYGNESWWREGVWGRLYDYQRRNIPEEGNYDDCVDSLDVANCLLLIDINWRNIFRNALSQDARSLIYELKGARNKWAHFGGEQQPARDAWRTLDTMSRLCMEIDQDAANEIEELMNQVTFDGQPAKGDKQMPIDDAGQTVAPISSAQKPDAHKIVSWRFMPKARWTQATLDEAVHRWCEENHRTLVEGFSTLEFSDAADAVLSMPLLEDSGPDSFRNAAESIVFLISDAKMVALTLAEADEKHIDGTADELDSSPRDAESGEPETAGIGSVSVGQGWTDLYEQFEHMPKQKTSWTRDDILSIAKSWADKRGRVLPSKVAQWRLDTLADMVLSRFPEQSDPAVSFNDSLPNTLFAPNTRKLLIVTHF